MRERAAPGPRQPCPPPASLTGRRAAGARRRASRGMGVDLHVHHPGWEEAAARGRREGAGADCDGGDGVPHIPRRLRAVRGRSRGRDGAPAPSPSGRVLV
jgi:hypothetical protein